MQKEKNKTYDLRVEKLISKPASEVFRAIGEGRLFKNCSADSETLKIDFKVGGKYSIHFLGHNSQNAGEFLEIVPNRRIVFTWCQDFESSPIPDTTVVIELQEMGGKTSLILTHTGFVDKDNRDGHTGGWTGGLNDLTDEMTIGKVHLTRKIQVPLEKFYEHCKNPDSLARLLGNSSNSPMVAKYIENIPSKRLVLELSSSPLIGVFKNKTKLTLTLEDEDSNSSWVEVSHEGLDPAEELIPTRQAWENLLKYVKL